MPEPEKKEKKTYVINRLSPPPEAAKRIIEKDALILPKNPIARFFKLFFGEGF